MSLTVVVLAFLVMVVAAVVIRTVRRNKAVVLLLADLDRLNRHQNGYYAIYHRNFGGRAEYATPIMGFAPSKGVIIEIKATYYGDRYSNEWGYSALALHVKTGVKCLRTNFPVRLAQK